MKNSAFHVWQLTASSWNAAKITAAFGVSKTVVGDSERRCQRHRDGPPPHTSKSHFITVHMDIPKTQ